MAVTSERQRGSRVDGSEKRPSEETKSQGRLSDLARVHRRLSDERAGMKDAACARTVEIRARPLREVREATMNHDARGRRGLCCAL